MTVGQNIKRKRIAAGLTQKEVGKRMGVTESAAGQFEKPEANPTIKTLYELASAIGCSVHDFLD